MRINEIKECLKEIEIFIEQVNGKNLPTWESSLIENGRLNSEKAELFIKLRTGKIMNLISEDIIDNKLKVTK